MSTLPSKTARTAHRTVPPKIPIPDNQSSNHAPVIICPCQQFSALSKVLDALKSDNRTNAMIDWLTGTTDEIAMTEQKLLSCGKRYQCRFRYGTSFAILDAIRDACAPFLQFNTAVAVSSSRNVKDSRLSCAPQGPREEKIHKHDPLLSYNSAFPPLPAGRSDETVSNILLPPTGVWKNGTAKNKRLGNISGGFSSTAVSSSINTLQTRKEKPKRRVQPQLTEIVSGSLVSGSGEPAEATTPQTMLDSLNSVPPTVQNSFSTPTKDTTNLQSSEVAIVDLATSSKVNTSTSDELPMDHLSRLVRIYVTLIRNMLIPSTPMQLHFLLQMLSIDLSQNVRLQRNPSENDGSLIFFRPLFSSSSRCVQFSQESLTRLEEIFLRCLNPHLIRGLVNSEVINLRCPKIIQTLTGYLETTGSGDEIKFRPLESVNPHAIFSLPFQYDRDSRHNYKTSVEKALYKNREESRDAFLFQLRSFMTAKSKVFLFQDFVKVRQAAQQESRRIVANLSDVNIVWFAQFFGELLLQVGLSPVEEMDQDLLSMVRDDRDKLQKLHSRMFVKTNACNRTSPSFAGTASRINEPYTARSRSNNKSASHLISSLPLLFDEAVVSFPGYQEFFFLFLYAVDSYKFSTHLFDQLAKAVKDLSANRSSCGLEKRIFDLKMLARFLGFLVFSPNWHEIGVDMDNLKPSVVSLDRSMSQLDLVGLPLSKIVVDAWSGGYIILVVPWVADLLQMSKWDLVSQSSWRYRQILAELRWIQKSLSNQAQKARNLQSLSFLLETFFFETVTLPKLTSLPPATLATQQTVPPTKDSLDSDFILHGSTWIIECSPFMESLSDFILGDLGTKKEQKFPRSSSKAKKLRPSTIGAPGIDSQSSLGIEFSTESMGRSDFKTQQSQANEGERSLGTRERLEDLFFHQHRDLKEICDFVIDRSQKHLRSGEFEAHVHRAMEEHGFGGDHSGVDFDEVQRRVVCSCYRKRLVDKIREGLRALGPVGLDPIVRQTAETLALARGMKSSEDLLHYTVASLLKTYPNIKQRRSQSLLNPSSDVESALMGATSAMNSLNKQFSGASSEQNLKLIRVCLNCIEMVGKINAIPSESALRLFFLSLIEFDSVVALSINSFIENESERCWDTLLHLLRLTSSLSRISVYSTNRITRLFGVDFDDFLSDCESTTSDAGIELLRRSVAPCAAKSWNLSLNIAMATKCKSNDLAPSMPR